MKKASGILLVGVACGFAAVGCSSTSSSDPYGPSPDFSQVQAKYQTPTGTFAAGSEASVVSGFGTQSKAQASGLGVGAGSPSTGTSTGNSVASLHFQSLHILDGSTGATATFCPALQSGQDSGSCACPNGGSIAYDFTGAQALKTYKGGPIDVTLKVRASACEANGAAVDGTEFANVRSNGVPTATDLIELFDVHLTATVNQVTGHLDADFEYVNGQFWFAVTVNDGTVIVNSDAGWDQASKTGKIIVRDKNGTWTCTFVSGKGSCTSDKGTTRAVAGI